MIYKQNFALHDKAREVYYRPTVGDCSCQYNFDGQDHLLFNLDNKRFFLLWIAVQLFVPHV